MLQILFRMQEGKPFLLNLNMPLYCRSKCIRVLLAQKSLKYRSFNLHVHSQFDDLEILEDPLLQIFIYQISSDNERFSIIRTTVVGSVLYDRGFSS